MKYPVTTICGSMRYFQKMITLAHVLTSQGYIVLMPFVYSIPPDQQENNVLKRMLDDMHFKKIDMSEYIHIVGPYIGKSTSAEIKYAEENHTTIIYINENEIK